MRILIVSEECPEPVVSGLSAQLSALLRELRLRHEVRVLAFGDGATSLDNHLIPPIAMSPLARAQRFVFTFADERASTPYVFARRMRAALQAELREFQPDVVHVASGRMAAVAPFLEDTPAIIAPLDADHLNAKARVHAAHARSRFLYAIEAARIRRFESHAYRGFASVIVVSEADRQALLALDESLPITVIPNGVDAGAFVAPADAQRVRGRIVFTGVMDHAPNITAATYLACDVLPRVKEAFPEAHLWIVGRSPTRSIRRLQRTPDVEVIGAVENMVDYLSTASVFACPMLHGTGIKNKLLEAMANGLATVVTPLALRGTNAQAGRDTLVADDATGFASHIANVLQNPQLAAALAGAAREYVTANHSWAAATEAFEEVYRTAISGATLPVVR